MRLSVVIPAYNEADNLKSGILDKVYQYLRKQTYSYEVILVDDGSTDGTDKIIEEQIKDKKRFKLIKNSHRGKALAVITGILKSSGEITLFTDMDQATPLSMVERFFPKFEEGYDIVIGSRKDRAGAPLIRKFIAWGFVTLRNLILGLPFPDTQCGFKAFSRRAVRQIFPPLLEIWRLRKANGAAVNAGFDIEMLFTAKKCNFQIIDVPVDWYYVESKRVPFLKNAFEAIGDMIRIRLGDLQGKYKAAV